MCRLAWALSYLPGGVSDVETEDVPVWSLAVQVLRSVVKER